MKLQGVSIVGARRLACSRSGNPRYDLLFSDGTVAITASDAAISYNVRNVMDRKPAVLLDVQLSAAGKVESWVRTDTGQPG